MTINIQQFRDAFAIVAGEFQGSSRYFKKRQAVHDMLYVGDGKGIMIAKSRGIQLGGMKRDYLAEGFRTLLNDIAPGSKIVMCLPIIARGVKEYAHFADETTGLLFEIQEFIGHRDNTIIQITMTYGYDT